MRLSWGGGVFITENYKPYVNTLTETELETLCRLYGKAEGKEKEIFFRIIHKYGADKLEIWLKNNRCTGLKPHGRLTTEYGQSCKMYETAELCKNTPWLPLTKRQER